MASVVTTQELRAGDMLLRYKAKAFEDDIPGIRARRPNVQELLLRMADACRAFLLLFHCFACFVFRLMFDILYNINSTYLLVASWLSEMETCTIFKKLDTPQISAQTPKSHHSAKT